MFGSIRGAIVTAIALITFLVIGARVVWDFQTWECTCSHEECEWCFAPIDEAEEERIEWELYHADAYWEYMADFTELFNSYETKTAKNGRVMIRRQGEKTFKFAKKG